MDAQKFIREAGKKLGATMLERGLPLEAFLAEGKEKEAGECCLSRAVWVRWVLV